MEPCIRILLCNSLNFFYVKALYCIFLHSSSAHMMQEAGLGLLTFCILLEEFLFYLFIVVQLLLALSN